MTRVREREREKGVHLFDFLIKFQDNENDLLSLLLRCIPNILSYKNEKNFKITCFKIKCED